MPTYDYRCGKCKHEFEEYQSITATPLKKCPACGKRALQRLIGAGGCVIFKGSGFHQTDYRSEAYKQAAKADSKSTTSSGDKKDGKSDAKSDTKQKPASTDKSKGSSGSASDHQRKAG